jgi:hypothetical protein
MTRRPQPPTETPALPTEVEALRSQLKLARLQNADLHKRLLSTEVLDQADLAQRLDMAKAAYRALRDQARQQREAHQQEIEDLKADHERKVARLTQERDAARWAQASAEAEARIWKSAVDLAYGISATRQGRAPTANLDQALKRILRVVHPDRWQQHQPASALAHELTVLVNDIRDTGGRQP